MDEDDPNPPLLFVDVNLDPNDKPQRIVVHEGETAEELAQRFCEEHSLDAKTQANLTELLEYQIASVLTKIAEEEESLDEDEHSPSDQHNL